MAAEDELALPQVPEAQPEDSEDISWALNTAEAMWARGDHVEGIKWVRKAAEAASEVENDERALQLAKAASELASLIARRSMIAAGEVGAAGPAPASAHPPSEAPPNTARMPGSPSVPDPIPSASARAPAAPKPAPISVPIPISVPVPISVGPAPVAPPVQAAPVAPPVQAAPVAPPAPIAAPVGRAPVGPKVSRSVPPGPIPLPSRASTPPKAPTAPTASRPAPRPLATNDAKQGPQAGRGILTNRTPPEPPKTAKTKRRSRDNLDAEAKAAGVLDTAPQTAVDGPTAERALSSDTAEVAAIEIPYAQARVKRGSHPEPGPTVVTSLKDLVASEREKSAEEWDASPTENLTGDEMSAMDGDRKTTAYGIPVAVPISEPQLAAVAPTRGPARTFHDPEIQTSQAVRVVVWRDANGVHVAPAGTVVSSITIDAVLVVLEPTADLTAWLSHRDR